MSEDTNTSESAATATDDGKSKVSKRQDRRFTREELVSNARSLTGQPSSVVAGAIAALAEDRKTFTRKQGKKLCEDFLKRPEEVDEAIAAADEEESDN